MSNQATLQWDSVHIASVGEYTIWVFADGTWELNDDAGEVAEGQAGSVQAAKREALGKLGKVVQWSRGARYVGRKYSALIVPTRQDALMRRPLVLWDIESNHPDHVTTSWSAGERLADGTAKSVRAAKKAVVRLLQRPRTQWPKVGAGASR